MSFPDNFPVNRKAKDSVFTDLFSDPEYVLALYRCLYPEDTTAAVADIQNLTVRNSLVDTIYNDLAFSVGNRLIALVEAQSTWSNNIVLREFLYLGPVVQRFLASRGISVHRNKLIELPRIDLYVLYTGEQGSYPPSLTMTQRHFHNDPCGVEVTVHILRDGQPGDIIYQYVGFTRVFNEQTRLHKDNKALAIQETIRVCRDRNLLAEYMKTREVELMDLLDSQFDYELAIANWREEEREQGIEQGIERGVERQSIGTAKKMLARGYDYDEIVELTGLSLERVRQLASSERGE